MRDNETLGLHERKCTQCGKIFEARIEYVYRIQNSKRRHVYDYFCSYKCLREHEKGSEDWNKRQQILYQLREA